MQKSWWTAERVDQLRILHAKGMSNAAIAREMGAVTRQVVIGKVHRLGLSDGRLRGIVVKPKQESKPKLEPRPSAEEKLARERQHGRVNSQVQAINRNRLVRPDCAPKVFEVFVPRKVDVVSLRKPLVELMAMECRYPDAEGDPERGMPHTFCGHGTMDGKSYCAAHAALVRGIGTPAERNAVPAKMLRSKAA